MIIKKLSDDCVKVLMERDDVEKYRITYQSLNEQDEQTVEFIYRLLFLIYDRTGVSFLDNAITVEAGQGIGVSYYITISRNEGISEGLFLTKEEYDATDTYIFELESLDFLNQIAQLLHQSNLQPCRQLLYKYMQYYYLLFDFTPTDTTLSGFSSFLQKMVEFADKCNNASVKEGYLCERGTLLSERPIF